MNPSVQVRSRVHVPTRGNAEMIDRLNQQLVDALDLVSHVKLAHWNVEGPQFYSLHGLFETLAGELDAHIDALAERATALGGTARGTVRQSAAQSRLTEYPVEARSGREHLEALVERFTALAATTRGAIDAATAAVDAGTADLFTGMGRALEKNIWFLDSHLR